MHLQEKKEKKWFQYHIISLQDIKNWSTEPSSIKVRRNWSFFLDELKVCFEILDAWKNLSFESS